MNSFTKVISNHFIAYIPCMAVIELDYREGLPNSIIISGLKAMQYCVVNGIRYYGNYTYISLDSNEQRGFVKQEAEVIERMSGALELGQRIKLNNTISVQDGKILFKPVENDSSQLGEYVMQIIPDYNEIIDGFFTENPELHPMIRSFLERHPHLLETTGSSRNAGPKKWISVSQLLKGHEGGDEYLSENDFFEENVRGIFLPDIADPFIEHLNK